MHESGVNDELATLTAKQDIRDLIATLASSMDRLDLDRAASCYTDDAHEEHGAFRGKARDYLRLPQWSDPRNLRMQHHLGQSRIAVARDGARAETYFTFHGLATRETGRIITQQSFGRFIDTLTKDSGSWRIHRRITVVEWGHERETGDLWTGADNFIRGARWPDDALYAELGLDFFAAGAEES